MKNLKQYITEKLKITKNNISIFKYHPQTTEELKQIIEERIENEGPECDLNEIDVSNVTDMSGIFEKTEFNGDISGWDVSNVKYMQEMFKNSKFTGENSDISNWNVSNVISMRGIFAYSVFDQDISGWNVSNVINMRWMFGGSKFTGKNGDISGWDVSNVKYMESMFKDTKFNLDISKWKLNKDCQTNAMFDDCTLKYQPEKHPQK